MTTQEFRSKAITLIDDLKSVCANYGLGNDGNEFKIITQVFLYKFLNDKFAHEVPGPPASTPGTTSRRSGISKTTTTLPTLSTTPCSISQP